MQILIVFDSIFHELDKVVNIMEKSIKEIDTKHLLKITSVTVDKVTLDQVAKADLLIIGSPTVNWKPTKEIEQFLLALKNKNLGLKAATSFGTKTSNFLAGSSAKKIEKYLKMLRFKIIAKPLELHEKDHTVNESELNKAKEFAKYIWMF